MPPPAIANTLLVSLDANDLVAVGDGNPVVTWTDQAQGFVLTQINGPNRPTFQTAVSPNGGPGVEFNNADWLVDQIGASLPITKTMIFCSSQPADTGNHFRWNQIDDGTGRGLIMMNFTGLGWLFGGSVAGGEFLTFADAALFSATTVWSFVMRASGALVRTNGTQRVTGNLANLVDCDSVDVGSLNNVPTPSLTLYEYLVYDGAVSNTDLATVEDYLQAKWIDAVPPPEPSGNRMGGTGAIRRTPSR